LGSELLQFFEIMFEKNLKKMCFLSVECVFLPKLAIFVNFKKFKEKNKTAFFFKKVSRKKF